MHSFVVSWGSQRANESEYATLEAAQEAAYGSDDHLVCVAALAKAYRSRGIVYFSSTTADRLYAYTGGLTPSRDARGKPLASSEAGLRYEYATKRSDGKRIVGIREKRD